MSETAPNRMPAMTASAVLHLALLASVLFVWPWTKPITLSNVVPVTLVTSDQASQPSEAVAAPTPQPPATETPTPEAPVTPAAPEPAPLPVPAPPTLKSVQAKPTPAPKPAPAKPVPTPAKASPKPLESTFDPDAVLASLTKSAKAAGAKQSSAKRGPPRPQTAVQARLTTGAGDASAASALNALGSALGKLWHVNCDTLDALAANDTKIPVTIRVSSSGRVMQLELPNRDEITRPTPIQMASENADQAVNAYVVEQSVILPPNLYGKTITVKFNSKDALKNARDQGVCN